MPARWHAQARATRTRRSASSARSSSTRGRGDARGRQDRRPAGRGDVGPRSDRGRPRADEPVVRAPRPGRARRRPRLARRPAWSVPLLRRPGRARPTADRGCAGDGREPGAPRGAGAGSDDEGRHPELGRTAPGGSRPAPVRPRTAIEHDKPSTALRASYNLADQLGHFDRYQEAMEAVRDALAQSRRVGNRYWELGLSRPRLPVHRHR